MFIGAQFKGCKRSPGRFFLDNEMSWLRMQKDIARGGGIRKLPSHGLSSFMWIKFWFKSWKKILCIIGFPHPCYDGLWGSECPRFIIVFQNVNLWISKFNFATRKFLYICPHLVVVKHALNIRNRNMFLISWKSVQQYWGLIQK